MSASRTQEESEMLNSSRIEKYENIVSTGCLIMMDIKYELIAQAKNYYWR